MQCQRSIGSDDRLTGLVARGLVLAAKHEELAAALAFPIRFPCPVRCIVICLKVKLRAKQLPAAEAQVHDTSFVRRFQRFHTMTKRLQTAAFLMQLIGARSILLQTPDDFFCLADARSTFSNQIRPTLFDRTDFPLKADADGIKLTGRDTKAGLKGRLEFADLMACAPFCKERSLYPPVQ